jgi:hypothetical protein
MGRSKSSANRAASAARGVGTIDAIAAPAPLRLLDRSAMVGRSYSTGRVT